MTNREKVIRGLECCAAVNCGADCPYSTVGGCRVKVLEDAIALLREQEAVKPITQATWPSPVKACESCGVYSRYTAGRPSYCPNCGSEMKWDD